MFSFFLVRFNRKLEPELYQFMSVQSVSEDENEAADS